MLSSGSRTWSTQSDPTETGMVFHYAKYDLPSFFDFGAKTAEGLKSSSK